MRMIAFGLVAALATSTQAEVRPESMTVAADRGGRDQRTVDFKAVPGMTGWSAIWDRDTDVPLRMWASTPRIAGSVANADIAAAVARQFLIDHLATLAPGAKPGDFELAANELSPKGDIRSIGFTQRAAGLPVLGGTISFAFKADRLALVGSTALPYAKAIAPSQRISPAVLEARASRWLADAGHTATIDLSTRKLVVVPIVRPRTSAIVDVTYRVAEQVDASAPDGRWHVWLAANDGAPIARHSTIMYTSGQLMFDVPDRYPGGTRQMRPAPFASVTIDGANATTDATGNVTWSGAGAATLRARGTYVTVNNAGGSAITQAMTLASGANNWSQATSETADAQLTSYVHANIVKQFAKTKLNPGLAWLDQNLSVNVNEGSTCNAYSTGDDIHFYRKGSQCENTGRIADVVYHEFGHSLHNHSIIPGVGQWDGALSEGLGDITAMLITHDHGMGRGFFLANPAPMRELDPATDKKWGVDTTGEVHDDGEIIGETFWDLLVGMEASLGASAGWEQTKDIYYTVMQRANDIPSSYAEALLGDDDDGDLTNGTPNKCALHAAFSAHGLASGAPPMGTVDKPVRTGFNISVKAQSGGTMSACPGPMITSGTITWRVRGGTDATIPMALVNDQYTGALPSQPNGTVLQYKIELSLSTGSKVIYPNNVADPYYEMYVGPVTPIWCSDFEAGATDWTSSMDWEAGAALGLGGDPKMAAAGAQVYGMDLSKDGVYAANGMSFAESPEIDLQGKTGVRLQYQRWLTVEDGFYDHARILANGVELWKNTASPSAPQQTGIDHVDREWRFADFQIADQAKVKLRFELASDEGKQLGGWTLDDVCLVTPAMGPGSANCGNGAVDDNEQCDDGNITDGDGCSALCETETPGGGGDDQPGTDESGCCSVGGGPEGALALTLLTLGMIFRRRRR